MEMWKYDWTLLWIIIGIHQRYKVTGSILQAHKYIRHSKISINIPLIALN